MQSSEPLGASEGKAGKPPYNCSTVWLEKIFDLARSTRITLIDNGTLASNNIAVGNESRLMNALKFLKLIQNDGKVTEKMALLNAEGETFTQNLALIVQDAYSDLLAKIQVNTAKIDHINGYFSNPGNWAYPINKAKDATKFFVWLARKAGIELSPDLSQMQIESRAGSPRTKRTDDDEDSQIPETPKSNSTAATRTITVIPTLETGKSNIQATITMSLDKDTPVEVWRMTLKLLGLKDDEPSSELSN